MPCAAFALLTFMRRAAFRGSVRKQRGRRGPSLLESQVRSELCGTETQTSLADLFLDCLQIYNQLTHSVSRPLLVEFFWPEF